MKSKALKRAVSASLSAILASNLTLYSLPQSVFAYSTVSDYVIYSDEDITVNMNKAVINGNVFSGSDFEYLGSDTCLVSKTLNADGTSGNIQSAENINMRTIKPDYTAKLKNGVHYKNICTGDTVFEMDEYDLNESVKVKGNLDIRRVSFSGNGYINAKGNIRYDAVQNDEDCGIFLYSSDGNITVQGANITLNGIIYAPNGTVELNAKNLTINGTIIAKKVEVNGTNLKINEMKEKDRPLANFGPEINFGNIEETYKVNRKISLDVSQSYGIADVDEDSLEWSFTSDLSAGNDSIKIDETTSTKLHKDLIITETGRYCVTLKGRDKSGNEIVYYDTIDVVEDAPPVAGFWKEFDEVERNQDGNAEIVLEDTSYSPDGDTIGSRVWSVVFDSDNDGDFSDEEEEVFCVGNETKVIYEAKSVGKYKFILSVAENFTDTIPSLVSDDAYLVARTSDNVNASDVTEVLNDAPVSRSGIAKAKNVDIVVTVGNADIEDIDTLNRNVKEIREELEAKGFSVNLSTVSTSTLTAKDTFAWDEYDHYNYIDRYLPTMDKHILYEDNSIKMMGYSYAPLRDWLFVDDGIDAKRVLSFDMVRDATDWHSMEGGGFLFNTSIKDVTTEPTNPDEEPVTVKKLNGYCILLTSGGFRLIQFDDIDAEAFRNGGISGSAQSVGKVLKSVSVANVYDSYNVKIIANNRLLSVYINNEPVIDNFVLPDNEKGTGFGPIICHDSHGCSQQSYFTFSNIKMSTVNGSELSDVLDNYKWRDSAEHFVINLTKESIYDLNDKTAVGSSVKSLVENNINFVGLGTSASKKQTNVLLSSTDGIYADWYDVLKDKDILKNYIFNQVANHNYNVDSNMITTSDELVYANIFTDKENDPVGNQHWEYELDSTVYENSIKPSGSYFSEEPLEKFDATGIYKISSRIMDDPTGGNSSLNDYKKWSNEIKWTDGLYVHSKPDASISSEIFATDNPEKFICQLTFDAEDKDCLSHENKGITAEIKQWKCLTDSEWHDGTVPNTIDAESVYLQKYVVCDEQGEWSKPVIEVIYAQKVENADLFSDDINPEVTLTVSDENPCVDDDILISVSASDNTDVAYVKTSVNGRVICEYQGSVIYNCKQEETLEITVECKDIAGNLTTETKTVTVTDRRDLVPPEIIIDSENDIVFDNTKVTINGTISDNSEIDSYSVKYAPAGSEDYIFVKESAGNVISGEIASFTLPEQSGKYNINITASDKAGNTTYADVIITVTEETITQEEVVTKTEEKPVKEYQDTPAEIILEASAEKAEIGEVVIIQADASDADGLVSFRLYKDDKLVSENPCEARISEAEPKTVTLRIETVDANGGKDQKSIEIIFEDTYDHEFPTSEIMTPENGSEVSGKVSIIGSAYDETGMRNYKLEYRKKGTSLFNLISSSLSERHDALLGEWDTYSLDNGEYEVRLTVTDNGGNSRYVIATYVVKNGAETSQEELEQELIVFTKPESNVTADDVLKIEAKVDSTLGKGEYTLSIQDEKGDGEQKIIKSGKIASDGTISAAVDTSIYDDGKYTVKIAVINPDGDDAEREITAVVKHDRKTTTGDYTCEIITPSEMDEVSGITTIEAKASSEVFDSYKLEYSPVGENSYVLIDNGTIAENGSITADFDTSLMVNGYYDIRLTAYSDKYKATDTVSADVKGNLKIGNFSLKFDDIDFDVKDIPVNIYRNYDSRRINYKEDFGYGWSMSYENAKVTVSGDQSRDWEQRAFSSGFITNYSIVETKKHRVKIDLGNGITDEFGLSISPKSQAFFPLEYDINISYVSLTDSGATLTACDRNPNGLIYSGGRIFDEDVCEYDPQQYIYTRADGTSYVLDVDKGLISVKTLSGESISFNDNGVICSNGNSIKFTRDAKGNITSIEDNTGRKITYEYNVLGDLVSVTDFDGNVTKFSYSEHYITEMYDARGIRAVRNEYDDDGRLVKTIDAEGNETTYEHNIEGRQEIVTDRNGGISIMTYDDNGNVTSETDPLGNTIKMEYDANGNLLSRTNALGDVVTYKYNKNGKLEEMTNAEGITVSNSYNSRGQLLSVSKAGIITNTYTYDDKGRKLSSTDANGNETDYSYDNRGNLTSITDEIGSYLNTVCDSSGNVISALDGTGSSASFTYDEYGNCTSKTVKYKENGVEKSYTESYSYDKRGNIVKAVDSTGNIITKEYNSIGKISAETDINGNQTKYSYDKLGNLEQVLYPDGTSEKFTYDKEGNTLTARDRNGNTATMTYDKVGNLLNKSYDNGTSSSYEYDANYNLVSCTDEKGITITYEYDKAGRNTAVTDSNGNKTTYSYNALSQITGITDAAGRTTSYVYDNNGNCTETHYADGTVSYSQYDARGMVTSKTDQNGYVTEYKYDKLSQLVSVTDALGGVTSYEYNEIGDLTAVVDTNGNRTEYEYDTTGKVIRTTNAAGQQAENVYDEHGNVVSMSDYAGNITKMQYDHSNRLVSKTNAEGTTTYSYQSNGMISAVRNNSGAIQYSYDENGSISRISFPQGRNVDYTNDVSGRKTSVTTSAGTTLYEYDSVGRISAVTDNFGNKTTYEYNKIGTRSAMNYANGIRIEYEYDEMNRLSSETVFSGDEVISKYVYTYGNAGEMLSVKENGREVLYGYDKLYRLVSETILTDDLGVTEYTYEYDNASNRTAATADGVRTEYAYNELNQLIKAGSADYCYDDAGNLISVLSDAESAGFEYNSDNMLIRAEVNGVEEEYGYDSIGNRIYKKSSDEYTYYLNDIRESNTQVIDEYDENGNLKKHYTRGEGLISQADENVYFYVSDEHDSVRMLMDSEGNITDSYSYDAWGNLTASAGETLNTHLYCGENYDSTTGNYYLRARYMNPENGVFTTMDTYNGSPMEPVTLNKYLYANANPVLYSDPTGHFGVLGWVAGIGVGYLISLVMSNCIQNVADNIFANMFSNDVSESDVNAAAAAGDGSETLDFEKMFRFNDVLATINIEISCLNMLVGYFKTVIGEASHDYELEWSGIKGQLSGAFSLAFGYQIRYDNYDYIFRYATEDYDDYIDDYKAFTLGNVDTTAASLVGVIGNFETKAGAFCGKLSALQGLKGILDKIVSKGEPSMSDFCAIEVLILAFAP